MSVRRPARTTTLESIPILDAMDDQPSARAVSAIAHTQGLRTDVVGKTAKEMQLIKKAQRDLDDASRLQLSQNAIIATGLSKMLQTTSHTMNATGVKQAVVVMSALVADTAVAVDAIAHRQELTDDVTSSRIILERLQQKKGSETDITFAKSQYDSACDEFEHFKAAVITKNTKQIDFLMAKKRVIITDPSALMHVSKMKTLTEMPLSGHQRDESFHSNSRQDRPTSQQSSKRNPSAGLRTKGKEPMWSV